ncbi:hypothetical protein [Mesobacillus sp.]|uniref:hypothetical protein n=1 Tax=Mesobacillus sp. TaxID=2675271 RepID=UPI0039EFFBD7
MKNPAISGVAGFLDAIKYRPRKEPEQIEKQPEWKNNQFWNPKQNIKNEIPKSIAAILLLLPSLF